MKNRINVVISMGDPAGVGPEVLTKAISAVSDVRGVNFLITGDSYILSKYGFKTSRNTSLVDLKSPYSSLCRPSLPNRYSSQVSIDCLNAAVSMVKNKEADALVTGPISKESVRSIGFLWNGHTEFLADSFGVKRMEMVFISDFMKVVLLTRHMALKKAVQNITEKRIAECGGLITDFLIRHYRIKKPRIAVCGVNPHASEGGVFGKEEIRIITPALKKLNKKGRAEFLGPFAADTLFNKDLRGKFDMIMAMYHDQGLIAFKATEFNSGVNLTAGLPFVRTSPVHGTAFDIAGTNKANFKSMEHAIRLACRLTINKR